MSSLSETDESNNTPNVRTHRILNHYLPPEKTPAWKAAYEEVAKGGINAFRESFPRSKGPDQLDTDIAAFKRKEPESHKNILSGAWSGGTLRQLLYCNPTSLANVRQKLINLVIVIQTIYPDSAFAVESTPSGGLRWLKGDIVLHKSPPVAELKGKVVDSSSDVPSHKQNGLSTEPTPDVAKPAFEPLPTRYYRVYYPRYEDVNGLYRVGVGLLTVPNADWRNATLELCYSNRKLTLEVADVQESAGFLYLRLKDGLLTSYTVHADELVMGDPLLNRPPVWTQLILGQSHGNHDVTIASYTTAHRQDLQATAGLMVFERITNETEATLFATYKLLESIPDPVRFFLYNKRLDVTHKFYHSLERLQFASDDARKSFQELAVVYQGYYRHPTKPETISLFRCEVHMDGSVECRYDKNQKVSLLRGFLQVLAKGNQVSLDLQNDRQTYRLHYHLPTKYENEYWIGNYAGYHDDADLPITGVLVLQPHNNPDKVDETLITFRQRPQSKQIEALLGLGEPTVPEPRALPTLPRFFARAYQGYFIKYSTSHMLLFSCTLDEHGVVRIAFKKGTHSDDGMEGQAQMVNQTVRFNLAYDAEAATYRIHYYLEKGFTDEEDVPGGPYWRGTYAGFHADRVRPIAGRVLLQVPEAGTEIRQDDIKITEFRRRWPNAGTILTLLGEPGIRAELQAQDAEVPEEAPFPFEGVYTCFVVSRGQYRSRVLLYRLQVMADATVLFERKGVHCRGVASVIRDKFLSIQFDGVGSFVGSLLFSLKLTDSAVMQSTDVDHLFGLLTRGQDDRLESSAVVMTCEAAPKASSEWEIELTREHPDFEIIDRRHRGLLSFLNGQIYRQIRLPMTANRPFRPRHVDYRRIAFYAACQLGTQLLKDAPALDDEKFNAMVELLSAHLRDSFQMGFAAHKFGGALIHKTEIDKRWALKQLGRKLEDDDLQRLRADVASLHEDEKLLRQAVTHFDALEGSERIVEAIYELWPHVAPQQKLRNRKKKLVRGKKRTQTDSVQNTKPETL